MVKLMKKPWCDTSTRASKTGERKAQKVESQAEANRGQVYRPCNFKEWTKGPDKVAAIRNMPKPTSKSAVLTLLGFVKSDLSRNF